MSVSGVIVTFITCSVFGKSRKSCKNLVLRRRKFTRILASLARIAPLKGEGKTSLFGTSIKILVLHMYSYYLVFILNQKTRGKTHKI